MAGRPNAPEASNQNNNLLDLGSSTPVYSSGQRPPVDDSQLLQRYNIDDSDEFQPEPRPSTSYDEFVGGGRPAPHNHDPTQLPPSSTRPSFTAPYMSDASHNYSQTSDLHNYAQYGDGGEDGEDDGGYKYYDAGGPSDDNIPGGGVKVVGSQHARNRTSLMSMAGMVDRAKGMLGMRDSNYSDMNLPLTEAGLQNSRVDTAGTEETHPVPEKKAFSWDDVKAMFGRKKVDPSTLGPRIIHLNNPGVNGANRWADNHISTAKYNVATFVPKFLLEQFSKYANLFFLFTAVLQQIPNVSPTNRYTTIVPLVIVLSVSAIKELVEDYKRKASDKSLNDSMARVLKGSEFVETKWIKVAVGDIVRVESEEPFPADLVLLASSEPEGLCYIETANLDGETNLKVKQAIPETAQLVSPADLGRLAGRVRSEQPNSSLYTYEATLTMSGGAREKELPLAPDQLLLRGATLRNTHWVHGVVVFTGHETKLMRNATATPIKRTDVERMLNRQILMLVAILLVLSAISTIGDIIVRSTAGQKLTYLYYGSFNAASQFFLDIFTYWVLYSNLVPISLFVTLELVKYYQAFLINNDLDIYYPDTDTPTVCRTSSLVEELGQIEYIFSDKTGTLTCNVMEFRQCTIGGIQYAGIVPEDRRATGPDDTNGIHDFGRMQENLKTHPSRSAIHHFLTLLATCHTVIPERKDEKSEIKYQAASPDEGALVEGAVMLGYRFVARKPRAVIIQVDGQELEYELLAVCEFNSTRKRMSTIFRCPDGKIRVYCKGADTVILERLAKENPIVDVTLQHLEDYATDGLRTLCLAMREIPEQEYQEWKQIYDKAATTVGGNRAEELDKAAEIIEHDLFLLGATAIEDRLQDGVPETIHTLQTAGIKVWVLTGDRQETAINIGMSCKLISEDMTLLIINEETSTATKESLQKKYDAVRSQAASGEYDTLALVIDGKSLLFALEKDMEKLFLDLAVMCRAVICCRVSPLQKALVVKLVKRHLKALLLAVGDGANDVSMIQAAHVGVGISGVEGLQAARSADVAIGQFRFLRKLLLVHGAWSYQRISKVILYSFYKNIAMFMTQFWVRPPRGTTSRDPPDPSYKLWTDQPLTFSIVFLPERLLRPSHLRIMDTVLLQRLVHGTAAVCHGHLRPIHLGTPVGPIPATVPVDTKGAVLPHALVLVMGGQRILPLDPSVRFLVVFLL